jgi:hypothetical protein
MVAATRPLRVEELAEIFAIEFCTDDAHNLVEGWRPDDPEEAILSACSTLIAIIDDEGSKIVQFSHFSVKEFLTSDRLQTSNVGNICQFYVRLDPAHTILARACLAVLLQMDEEVDKERLATFRLAFYATQHWFEHAKFGEVASQIQDSMERLFDLKQPYFRAWMWIFDPWQFQNRSMVHLNPRPPSTTITPLYCAVICGLSGIATYLIITQAEDVNVKCGDYAPLHLALSIGMFDIARLLLDHGADVDIRNADDWTPLLFASRNGHVRVAQLLLEHEASPNAKSIAGNFPLYLASQYGHLGIVRLLLDHGADVKTRSTSGRTLFWVATQYGHHDIAQLLLEHGAERA